MDNTGGLMHAAEMTTTNAPTDTGVATFSLESTLARLPLAPTAKWPAGVFDAEVFRQEDVSISLFAPREADHQTPHEQDEAYVVVQGEGILNCDGVLRPFQAGDVLYVPAGQRHHFEGDLSNLVTWVVFWQPPDRASLNKTLIERFVAAWQSGDVDAALAFTSPECVYSMTTGPAPGREYVGRDAVREGFQQGIDTGPGTRAEFEEPVATKDRAFLEWRVVRTSDSSVVARGVDLFTLHDGLIVAKDAHRKVDGA